MRLAVAKGSAQHMSKGISTHSLEQCHMISMLSVVVEEICGDEAGEARANHGDAGLFGVGGHALRLRDGA